MLAIPDGTEGSANNLKTDRHGNRSSQKEIGIIRIVFLNDLHFSRQLFSFYRTKPSASLLHSQSARKCFRNVMNLRIIGNTFVNIRINSLTLHFLNSD